ncbi:MAG: ABC transporter permease [Clostridiales bacterium]|nr:ABC transporter permease [Clostridiales bacterium]
MVARAPKGDMLRRKLLRDMAASWKAFTAVLILCALSVTLWLGIRGAAEGMERSLLSLFAQSELADLWVSGQVSDQMARRIARLPGATDAQRRVRLRVEADLPGDPKMDLYMYDGGARVSRPTVVSGRALSESERGACLVDMKFAGALNVRVGDALTVLDGEQRRELRVVGICYSPEYVVHSDGYAFNVDPATFGYAFVSPGTLADVAYNETVVKLEEGANARAAKRAVEDLIDDARLPVVTRDDRAFIKMAVEEADQVRAMGEIFPSVFFLVAALITFSTMRRLVENQRLQLGTLYSLGYSRPQLTRHYAGYGFFIALAGAAIGALGGRFFLGRVAMDMLTSLYVMPGGDVYMNPAMVAAAAALIAATTTGASLLSSHQALREAPAGLMRPRPPRGGRRVLLERIPFVWRRLTFSAKLIVRNMLRNAPRFVVGVVGVVGCSMLLLTGFGMRDSVDYVLGHFFTYNMRYGARVDLAGPTPEGYDEAVRVRAGAERIERVMEGWLQVWADGDWQQKMLTVLEDRHDMVYLDYGGARFYLPPGGAAITRRAAEDMGVAEGDLLRLRASGGREADVRVAAIIDLQLNQGLYFSRTAWRHLDVADYAPTALLLAGGAIDLGAIEDLDGVAKARTIEEERGGKVAVTGVMDLLVVVMTLFAGALLLVVMYTLGELNFYERMRELATLMVLGFYPRETKRLILRENIVIAIVGLPVGLLLGPWLHRWVLKSGLPSILQFVPYISTESWIYTGALTLLFAWVVNRLIGAKFRSVNMVEALKSVE